MLFKLKNKKNSYSFTLIELLVVIGIIVILSSVVMVASGPFQEQARDNKRKEDLAAYQNALQIYYSEHKTYPSITYCCAPQCLQSYLQDELSPLPQDPLDPNCSGGNYGYYYTSEDGKNYKLYAKLERDFETMKNDGGVDETAYEVYSTLGNQLAVNFYLGGTAVSTALECSVISSESCALRGGLNVLGLSAATNAHAQLSNFLAQESWLTNWSSRKAIIVDNTQNSSTLTDYQVSVDTTNAIYNETGLVGSWHMNESSGTVASDMSGNSNNGTLTNGPTWTTGKFGSGLSFDGVDDYVGNITLGNMQEYTAETWIKWDGNLTDHNSILAGRTSSTGYFSLLAIRAPDGELYSYRSSADSALVSSFIVPINEWVHLVIVQDSTYHILYANGEEVGRREGNIPYSALEFVMGKGYSGRFFNGLIDEARIYNRALSADEISAHYNAGKARLDYGDVRFTDSDGTTLLNYWQESDKKSWIKIPSIPANSTKTIYMYYGNPAATSQSNGDNTFEFFDDFEGTSLNTDKWYISSGTVYTVSGEILKITQGAIGLKNALSVNLNSGYLAEGKIQYNTISETTYSGVLETSSSRFIGSSNSNSDATILYMVNSPASSQAVVGYIGNGSTTGYNIASGVSIFTMNLGTWYILGNEITPATAAFWKDYTRIVNYSSVSWSKNINYISLGDFAGNGSSNIKDTSYDWIRIRQYTSPEPTATLQYDYCVCCFGPRDLSNDCNATNKSIFLKLSASANAHAEKNTQSSYSNSACISTSLGKEITCTYREGNCQESETTLCSISGDTNAHISSPDTYNIKVCCRTRP